MGGAGTRRRRADRRPGGRDAHPSRRTHRRAVGRRRAARRARREPGRPARDESRQPSPRSATSSSSSAAPTTRSSATTSREALVDFARASNATQLVIGVSRRSRLSRPADRARDRGHRRSASPATSTCTSSRTRRPAGGLAAAPPAAAPSRVRRRSTASPLALIAGPLLTLLLLSIRSARLAHGRCAQLPAARRRRRPRRRHLARTLRGGAVGAHARLLLRRPATTRSRSASRSTCSRSSSSSSSPCSSASSSTRPRGAPARPTRATAEAELLATVAGGVIRGEDAVQALVSRTREAFGLTGVRLVSRRTTVLYDRRRTGRRRRAPDQWSRSAIAGTLELSGRDLHAADRRLLAVIVTPAGCRARAPRAHRDRERGRSARRDRPRAQRAPRRGRPRSAPSARRRDRRRHHACARRTSTWSTADREELLETAEESLAALADLVTNLLDVSRRAGRRARRLARRPSTSTTSSRRCSTSSSLGPADVELDVPADLPPVAGGRGAAAARARQPAHQRACAISPAGSRPHPQRQRVRRHGARSGRRPRARHPRRAHARRSSPVPAARRHRQHHGHRARARALQGLRRRAWAAHSSRRTPRAAD